MSDTLISVDQRQQKPRIIEIVGLAGAGKTTLFKALGNYPERISLMKYPRVNKAKNAPFFIRYGPRLFPMLIRLYQRPSRLLSQREFAWLTVLSNWSLILQEKARNSNQVLVLDQGPVYLLAELSEFGPEYLRSEKAERFWQEIYCQWASTLDLIVWLDAEDKYLMERIQTRAKNHIVKHEQKPVVVDFLTRFRKAYDGVVCRLGNCANGPRVLRIDNSKLQPEETVRHLLVELDLL